MAAEKIDIPLVIGGKEIRTGKTEKSVMPHDHQHVLAEYHEASPEHVQQAIAAAAAGAPRVGELAVGGSRRRVLRAAELLATTWRPTINAATMLGQSKTAFQAEIDAASEMIDFWRFNAWFAQELYSEQPVSSPGMWNQMEYRPLEGFVYAITPFNFTAIGGNLTTAPALMGNTVIWKPASRRDAERLLHAQGARSRRPAAGRHQLPARGPDRDLEHPPRFARARGHALHRQHGRVQQHVEARRREHRQVPLPIRVWSAKPAARTSSSRIRRPIRRRWRSRSRAAASNIRARSARRRAASTFRSRCGATCATARSR